MTKYRIYRRHTTECPEKADRTSSACKCACWAQWQDRPGHQVKKSLGTTDWKTAEATVAKWMKKSYSAVVNVPMEPEATEVTITDAVRQYVQHKVDAGLSESTISHTKNLLAKLEEYARRRAVVQLAALTPDLLRDWRSTWHLKRNDDGSLTWGWRVQGVIVKGFFNWCLEQKKISSSPAVLAIPRRLKITADETMPFSDAEVGRIFAAVGKMDWTEEKKARVLGVLYVQRYAGLSLRDAATLRRDRLNGTDALHLRRQKSKQVVTVPIPGSVAKMLRSLKNDNPLYFFWSGASKPVSVTNQFTTWIREVFEAAGIKKAGHMQSHRLRDTFAARLLEAGVSLETVSIALGHADVATTQRHYAAFTSARQKRVEDEIRKHL